MSMSARSTMEDVPICVRTPLVITAAPAGLDTTSAAMGGVAFVRTCAWPLGVYSLF